MPRHLRLNVAGRRATGVLDACATSLGEAGAQIVDVNLSAHQGALAMGVLVELTDGCDVGALCRRLQEHAEALGLWASAEILLQDQVEDWAARGGRQRHRVTLLGRRVPAAALARVLAACEGHGLSVVRVQRLTSRDAAVDARRVGIDIALRGALPDPNGLRAELLAAGERLDVDIAVQLDALHRRLPRLVAFDMDSTLIQCECIDELAARAGSGAEVAAITAAAMRGEIDFRQSLAKRLATLRDLPASVIGEIGARLPVTPGLERLIAGLKQIGCRLAIISGGFTVFGRLLQERFGFDDLVANELEIVDGVLTGRVLGEVVDAQGKAASLRAIAARHGIPIERTVAVGDGANDLPMLAAAGTGIAFHAKPLVRGQAPHALSVVGIDAILTLLGLRDWELEEEAR